MVKFLENTATDIQVILQYEKNILAHKPELRMLFDFIVDKLMCLCWSRKWRLRERPETTADITNLCVQKFLVIFISINYETLLNE